MSRRFSLRSLLLVPLVLQLAVTAGVISLTSYQRGQWAANELASRTQQRASRQVADYLSTYLRTPQQVIRLMGEAVASGHLDPNDHSAVIRYLWFLHRLFPDAPYLNYGWANGDFIGLGQADNTSRKPFLEIAQADSVQRLEQFRLTDSGQQGGLERIKPFADFRSDGWYAKPLQAGRAAWTPIYNWVDAPEVMAMGAGLPIRRQGVLIGVAGVDVFLANICRFLQGLPVTQSGEIYIVEGDGRLVADTSGELPFSIEAGRGVRHRAQESSNVIIRETSRALVQSHGSFRAFAQPQRLSVPLHSGEALVRIDPYRDAQGLDWRIVVVIPAADVYGNLRQQALGQLGLSLVAILISGSIGFWVVNVVIRHLDHLVRRTDAMADGDLSQNVEPGSIEEIARLAASFNSMAERLRRSFITLRGRNRDILRLANQVQEALALSEQQLQRETLYRQQLEETMRVVVRPGERELLVDPLTGLLSRRGLVRRLSTLATPLSVLRLHGSPTPEGSALQQVADRLERLAAAHDGVATHDGDGDFTLVLSAATVVEAQRALEELALQLTALELVAGIAALAEADDAGPARLELLARADQALAEARAEGVVCRIAS